MPISYNPVNLAIWFFMFLSIFFFLHVYTYYSKRPLKILRKLYNWQINIKNVKIRDHGGLEEVKMKTSLKMGIISIFIIISIFLVEKFNISYKIIYIPFWIFIIVGLYGSVQERDYHY